MTKCLASNINIIAPTDPIMSKPVPKKLRSSITEISLVLRKYYSFEINKFIYNSPETQIPFRKY
jgi:hypothetical protein